MLIRRIPVALLAMGVLPGCKADRPPADTPAAAPATPAPAPAAGGPITVTATDFKLDMPATIAAGAVTLRLVNQGKEIHQAQLVRLEDGKTLADFQKGMTENGPPPPWVKFVGGPNGVAPGQEGSATVALSPGPYVALCIIPGTDGIPHMMKGMIQQFEVTAGAGEMALPAATDTIRLAEYSFEPTRPLTAGHHTILVENSGAQAHELVLLKLEPGKSVADFGKWATTGGMQGPPPAMPVGGVGVVEHGASIVFTTDLAPGEYGFICFVPDAKDGKMHLEHGMMRQFRVG